MKIELSEKDVETILYALEGYQYREIYEHHGVGSDAVVLQLLEKLIKLFKEKGNQ